MEWRMFETKERVRSAKEKLFRLIKGLEKESSCSLPTPVFTVATYETVNSRINNSLEAELKKAEALMYQRMFNQPK
jgi:hypothetical protein